MRASATGTRFRLAAPGAAVFAAVLTGCTPFVGQACPAIGWINTIDIRLEGSADEVERVAWVELCDDRGCSTPVGPPAPPAVPGFRPPGPPTPPPSAVSSPASPSSAPEPAPPYYQAEPGGRGQWTIRLDMGTPDTVTVRAFAEDSSVLGEVTAEPTWTRIGGSEECGGPMATEPLALDVRG